MVLPAGAIWGALYWTFDEPTAALFPWGYTVASIACLAAFSRTRSFAFFRTAELGLILVTPALLCATLGGLSPSGGVVLWSLLGPLGALVFDPARAGRWFAAFVALLAATIPLASIVRRTAPTSPSAPSPRSPP